MKSFLGSRTWFYGAFRPGGLIIQGLGILHSGSKAPTKGDSRNSVSQDPFVCVRSGVLEMKGILIKGNLWKLFGFV